jgi:Fur family transcriptional regulator, peroxide stress response regulator
MDKDPIEVERRVEGLKAILQQAGVKLTHQRLEIFREIASSLEHPDAENVFRNLQARLPMLSLDTVYRTLWTLNDLGLIKALGPRHQSVRFDANLAPHHHFICLGCGLVRDFESPAFDQLQVPQAALEMGRVLGTQVEIRGLCDRCAKAQVEKPLSVKAEKPKGQKGRKP